MKQIDFDEARRFIAALGKPAGTLRLRAFFHAENPKKKGDKGRKGSVSRKSMQEWQDEGRGVYVVINDGGDLDAEITTCRAFFCEWDDRPTAWQITAWQQLGLPEPTMQVSTGGKSIHNYWVLSDPITPAHWELLQSRLLEYADADRSIKNLSRVMRLPGTYHAGGDGALGDKCQLISCAGTRYSISDLESCLPSEEFYKHEAPAKVYTEQPTRTIQEIKNALDAIPSRIPGTGTYHIYRNILWGLVKAVAEVGGTDADAVDLMQQHSPQFLEAAQVAASGGARINAGTFWYWARHYGWRPPLPIPIRIISSSVATEATPDTCQLFSKTDTEWLETTIKFVFNMPTDKWICVDDILHKWIGTHYAPITDNDLAPIVAEYLSQLYVIDAKTGEHCHPWKRPRYVDETFAWVRKLLTPVDINPSNAINCNNGVLSWSWNGRIVDVKLEPHNYNHFFTYVTGYSFDENANPQHLWRLLEAVEPGDRDTMQRILGSGLDLAKYRGTRGRPRAVLMIGEGANGKDTIRTALRDTLGARNFTSCTLADFRQYDTGRKFPIAPVRDSSVNWSSENSQFVSIDNLQSLKAAISGEELSYELKGVQESQFVPSALFVFNLNKDPSLTGEQVAIETRFHVFKFRKTFMATPLEPSHIQADPKLKDDPEFIREHICPAFLNWLLEGLKLSVEHGIDYATGRAAMEDVKRAGCHLWEFCDSVGLRYEPDSTVSVSRIYKMLTNWYKDEGYLDTNGRWLLDAPSDRPVKAARLLVPALMRIFPKLASDRATSKSRDRLIIGLKLDDWADLRTQ